MLFPGTRSTSVCKSLVLPSPVLSVCCCTVTASSSSSSLFTDGCLSFFLSFSLFGTTVKSETHSVTRFVTHVRHDDESKMIPDELSMQLLAQNSLPLFLVVVVVGCVIFTLSSQKDLWKTLWKRKEA